MLTDNVIMVGIIQWMISQAKNKQYIEKLNIIIDGIKNKKHIEESKSPRYMSIVLFGKNIFPFSIKQYREMYKLIERKHEQ